MTKAAVDYRIFGDMQLGQQVTLRTPNGTKSFEGVIACMGIENPNAGGERGYFTMLSASAIQRAPVGAGKDYWRAHGQTFWNRAGHTPSWFYIPAGRKGGEEIVSTHHADVSQGHRVLSANQHELAVKYRPGTTATYRYGTQITSYVGHLMTPAPKNVERTSGSVYVREAVLRRVRVDYNGELTGAPCTFDLILNRPNGMPNKVSHVVAPAPFAVEAA